MRREAVSLEQREADLAAAELAATEEAERWLEARVRGRQDDDALTAKLDDLRRAAGRRDRTVRRLT